MIYLFEKSYSEARALCASGAPVYLGVNPVEFHGPHLSLHNDTLISFGLAKELHGRLAERSPAWPFLIANDIEVGVEPTSGLGSRHTRFEVVRELVLEASAALADLGAQRVVFMTFHGAPLHAMAIQAGVDYLQHRGVRALSPLNVLLRMMLDLDVNELAPAVQHIADPDERQAVLDALQFDFHAGFFETSLAMHFAPESVSPELASVSDCPPVEPDAMLAAAAKVAQTLGRTQLALELRYAAFGVGWNALRPFPGYTSRPRHATASVGNFFAQRILAEYVKAVDQVLYHGAPAPTPIMTWMPALTLNGRVGSTKMDAATLAEGRNTY